jgi:hypothetical protein
VAVGAQVDSTLAAPSARSARGEERLRDDAAAKPGVRDARSDFRDGPSDLVSKDDPERHGELARHDVQVRSADARRMNVKHDLAGSRRHAFALDQRQATWTIGDLRDS